MKISFYQTTAGNSPVEKFITSLPKSDQARFAEIYKGILEYGFDCPRIQFKALEKKLWEIKFKTRNSGYRILYITIDNNGMVWLHAFKKTTQKTPKREIKVAKKRMEEVL